MLIEANVDALVGPTHHFGGLGVGNVASHEHANRESYPKKAALQGLEKAALVASLGVPQFIWLPPVRPQMQGVDNLLGASTSEKVLLAKERHPAALSAACSSAFMWAANSCTITPSADSLDGKIHATPANLISSWHRFAEADERSKDLEFLFRGVGVFQGHEPLLPIVPLRDEGAANHMRLSGASGELGINVFVHGEEDGGNATPTFFPRHTRGASEAIASRHRLNLADTFFLQQHPDAISAGAFHNDVIATSHAGLLIHHEQAFWEAGEQLGELEKQFSKKTGVALVRREVSARELPLEDAIRSYFFNSQILTRPSEKNCMVLVCPRQCQEIRTAQKLVDNLIADGEIPIAEVHFVDLNESMANGGGPACLRLRVEVTEDQLARMSGCLRLESKLIDQLRSFIDRRYPDSLRPDSLYDVDFLEDVENVARDMRRQFLLQ